MTFNHDRVGGFIVLVFCCAYGLLTLDIPTTTAQLGSAFSARTMPIALTIIGIGLSLSLLVSAGSDKSTTDTPIYWARGASFLVLMSVYGLAIRPVGFLIATIAFLCTGFVLLGERRLTILTLLPTAVAGLFWLLLSELLGVYIAPVPALWSADV